MTTTTTTTEPITAPQLRALRNADDVVFNHRADGSGEIRATIEAAHSSTGFEQAVYIPCLTAGPLSNRTGFEHMAKYHEGWRTLVHHVLRVGDVLVLDFRPDHGTTNYTRAASGDPSLLDAKHNDGGDHRHLHYAGLHVDEFWLRIERGTKRLEFLVEVRVAPENSARMCAQIR